VVAGLPALNSVTMGNSTAVAMLFQKPRQGRGAMEPRFSGGAVTEFG
jgi:hypothetical protein